VLASIRTDGVHAASAARRMVELDSTDFDGWSLLAYVHRAYGWQYGAALTDARTAGDRVVYLDPTYVPGLAERAGLAAMAMDSTDIRQQLIRLQEADTTQALVRGTAYGLRMLLAPVSSLRLLAEQIARRPLQEWIAAFRLVRSGDPSRAALLAEALERTAPIGRAKSVADATVAQLRIARGQILSVDSAIAVDRNRFGGEDRRLERFIVASSIAGLIEPNDARRAVTSLGSDVPLDSAVHYVNTRSVIETGWALAAYHATVGDTGTAQAWRDVFAQLPDAGFQTDYRGSLRADIDARLAARRGDVSRAQELAGNAVRLWSVHSDNVFEDHPEVGMRFHLGTLLRINGGADSAVAIFRSLVPPTSWFGFYTPRAALELAELAAEIGEAEQARHYYRMVLSFWEASGPEVTSWRERVEAGLAALATAHN